jgi:hypothetical protein
MKLKEMMMPISKRNFKKLEIGNNKEKKNLSKLSK